MTAQNEAIAEGFGQRLREERKRLGLNQEEMAQLAGIQRIAQSQYELGGREPRISYLAAIGAAGVNLGYLLFGKSVPEDAVPPMKRREIEKTAFDMIEEYVQTQCGGTMSSDGRFVLFEVMRSQLMRAAAIGLPKKPNVADFLPLGAVKHG